MQQVYGHRLENLLLHCSSSINQSEGHLMSEGDAIFCTIVAIIKCDSHTSICSRFGAASYVTLAATIRLSLGNKPIEVQDFRKIAHCLRGIYGIYLKSVKENQKMSTCNHLDLKTLGSRPIMPNNVPGR